MCGFLPLEPLVTLSSAFPLSFSCSRLGCSSGCHGIAMGTPSNGCKRDRDQKTVFSMTDDVLTYKNPCSPQDHALEPVYKITAHSQEFLLFKHCQGIMRWWLRQRIRPISNFNVGFLTFLRFLSPSPPLPAASKFFPKLFLVEECNLLIGEGSGRGLQHRQKGNSFKKWSNSMIVIVVQIHIVMGTCLLQD